MKLKERKLRKVIRGILKENNSKDIEFVYDVIFVFEEFAGTRKIVIVKTKSYGNVAFYKRSGHGNNNSLNPEQSAKLEWLPFGGLCTSLESLLKKDYKSGKYIAGGVEWFCKLPPTHPEGDGTGKFLNVNGEFYKICLSLTENYSESDFKIVHINDLIKQYFGKSIEELKNINLKTLPFRIPFLSESLFGGVAVNKVLEKAGAIQTEWLPSGRYEWTGTSRWGSIIRKNCGFKDFNGEILKQKLESI